VFSDADLRVQHGAEKEFSGVAQLFHFRKYRW